jgi:uncharacterized repeat protein (TIGR01451 family)
LAIVKSADKSSVSTVGQVITYSFLVTNTGNVTMSNVVVDDTQLKPAVALTSGPTCPVTTLAPGASTTCTATYTVTQADLDNGSVNDSATATGTPPGSTTDIPPSTPSEVTVPATPLPGLSIVKSADKSSVSTVGQVITYSFLVTNTGNVTLHGITVNETAFSGTGTLSVISCPTTALAPAESTTCTAVYTVTQSDIEAGKVTNTAIATGTPPTGTPLISGPSTATVTAAAIDAVNVPPAATPSTPAPSALAYTGVAVPLLLVLSGLLTLLGGLIALAGRGRRTRAEDAR